MKRIKNAIQLTKKAYAFIKRVFKKKPKMNKDILKAKSGDVDMGNLFDSINGSRDLYKKLSRKCHPDRFVGSDKQSIAEKLMQEVTKNKRNFNKLTELEKQIQNELY